jgi:hypothetical protein
MKNKIYKFEKSNLKYIIRKIEKTGNILNYALGWRKKRITPATPVYHIYPSKIGVYHFYYKIDFPKSRFWLNNKGGRKINDWIIGLKENSYKISRIEFKKIIPKLNFKRFMELGVKKTQKSLLKKLSIKNQNKKSRLYLYTIKKYLYKKVILNKRIINIKKRHEYKYEKDIHQNQRTFLTNLASIGINNTVDYYSVSLWKPIQNTEIWANVIGKKILSKAFYIAFKRINKNIALHKSLYKLPINKKEKLAQKFEAEPNFYYPGINTLSSKMPKHYIENWVISTVNFIILSSKRLYEKFKSLNTLYFDTNTPINISFNQYFEPTYFDSFVNIPFKNISTENLFENKVNIIKLKTNLRKVHLYKYYSPFILNDKNINISAISNQSLNISQIKTLKNLNKKSILEFRNKIWPILKKIIIYKLKNPYIKTEDCIQKNFSEITSLNFENQNLNNLYNNKYFDLLWKNIFNNLNWNEKTELYIALNRKEKAIEIDSKKSQKYIKSQTIYNIVENKKNNKKDSSLLLWQKLKIDIWISKKVSENKEFKKLITYTKDEINEQIIKYIYMLQNIFFIYQIFIWNNPIVIIENNYNKIISLIKIYQTNNNPHLIDKIIYFSYNIIKVEKRLKDVKNIVNIFYIGPYAHENLSNIGYLFEPISKNIQNFIYKPNLFHLKSNPYSKDWGFKTINILDQHKLDRNHPLFKDIYNISFSSQILNKNLNTSLYSIGKLNPTSLLQKYQEKNTKLYIIGKNIGRKENYLSSNKIKIIPSMNWNTSILKNINISRNFSLDSSQKRHVQTITFNSSSSTNTIFILFKKNNLIKNNSFNNLNYSFKWGCDWSNKLQKIFQKNTYNIFEFTKNFFLNLLISPKILALKNERNNFLSPIIPSPNITQTQIRGVNAHFAGREPIRKPKPRQKPKYRIKGGSSKQAHREYQLYLIVGPHGAIGISLYTTQTLNVLYINLSGRSVYKIINSLKIFAKNIYLQSTFFKRYTHLINLFKRSTFVDLSYILSPLFLI